MRPWRLAGTTLTVLTLTAGSVSVWSWLARREELQHTVYQQTVSSLSIELSGGDVTIVAGPAGRVTVDRRLTWSYGRPEINEDWTGTALVVRASCDATPRLPGCAVGYRIEAPPEVRIDVLTGDGAVSVRDLTGSLSLTTNAGPVRVTNASGPLKLVAGDGNVTGSGLRSPDVTASASNGRVDLRFTAAPTTVRASAADGDVGVVVPPADAYNLHASTRAGGRTVTVREDPGAARVIDVETGNGDVHVAYGA